MDDFPNNEANNIILI